jgi:hypothetical protein
MSTREAVAAAVDDAGIPGVAGSQWPPVVRRSGVCWAQFAGADPHQYGDGSVEIDGQDWDVILILPAENPATTAKAMDDWLPPLLAALSPLGRLGRVDPVQVALGPSSTTAPGVQIRLTTTD